MNLLLRHIKRFRLLSALAIIGKRLKFVPGLPIVADELIKLYVFIFCPLKFKKMQLLIENICSEPEVEKNYHRFGGIEFKFHNVEIAHLHSNALLDIHFSKRISKALIEQHLCEDHHVFPGSGWISFYINAKADIIRPLKLMKWSKELKTGRKTSDDIAIEIERLK